MAWMPLLTLPPPTVLLLLLPSLLHSFHPLFTIALNSSLSAGESITGRQTLVSPGGTFAVGFFTPRGFSADSPSSNYYLGIWYHSIHDRKVVWVANRGAPFVGSSTTTSLTLTHTGDLVVTNGSAGSPPLWSAGVRGRSPVASVTDNGNFAVVAFGTDGKTKNTTWESFKHPVDTLLPGMMLGVSHGVSYSLTSWTGPGDPNPGIYTLAVRMRGIPELVISGASATPRWRAGPWMQIWNNYLQGMFVSSFVNTAEEVFYSYTLAPNASFLSRLVVNTSGTMERWVWAPSGGSGGWTLFEVWPDDQCEYMGRCGNYGICDSSRDFVQERLCRCMSGFAPRNPSEWGRRGWTGGCVRLRKLDCRYGSGAGVAASTTDGFVRFSKVKLPDTVVAVVETGWGKSQCRDACRRNCSCTAYAVYDGDDSSSGWCMMWFGELVDVRTSVNGPDLFVRVAGADADREDSHKKNNLMGVTIGCIVSVLVLSLGSYLMWRSKSRGWFHPKMSNIDEVENSELPPFDLATILDVTNNFSEESILGEGGFGPVHKGTFSDGQEVAIKRLSHYSTQGQEEFKNEMMLIGKLQHKNLVRLLGYCINGNERILVYEFMPRKSLDRYLFDKDRTTNLDWQTRYRIIIGIARGLLYLHNDSRLKIIHRDLKAANILLDENMEPKISDFGLARVFDKNQTESQTKRVVGTYGYMPPEYVLDGVFSMKSDIFSFGVLILEIVSGLKNKAIFHKNNEKSLLGQAWSLWKEGRGIYLLDPTMHPLDNEFEVLNAIRIALLYVQETPEDRPTMPYVALMLGSLNTDSLPDPKEPGYVSMKDHHNIDLSSTGKGPNSIYGITITIYEGR